MGHLMRCLSLAEAVRKGTGCSNHEILFRTNALCQPFVQAWGFSLEVSEGFGLDAPSSRSHPIARTIVFDAYGAGSKYLSILKSQCESLWIFDDNNDQYQSADVDGVINGNLHALSLDYRSTVPNARTLLGPRYLVMKPEYWDLSSIPLSFQEKRIMITSGAADPHDLVPRCLEALQSISLQKTIIIGPSFTSQQIERIRELATKDDQTVYAPNSLMRHIQAASLVITAGGSTVYEVLRMRRTPLAICTADNQHAIVQVLGREGLPCFLDQTLATPAKIRKKTLNALEHLSSYTHIGQSLCAQLDGGGAMRVAEVLNRDSLY